MMKEGSVAFQNLIVEKKGRIARIALNRPDVLNALNAVLIGELDMAVGDIIGDDEIGVVIVTGVGEKAFAAGADISEIAAHDAKSGRDMAARGQRVLRRLETLGKPSIAAVNGFALGGGCEIAMACSIRIASDRARFGQPEVNLGVIPGYAGTQRLSRLVGKGVAMELTLTGRIIDAAEALRIGLVNQVVPHSELKASAEAVANTLLEKGPLALRAAMDVIDQGYDMDLGAACDLEVTRFAELCATEDMKEGTRAFLEKRKANFKGK
jgi:enoyl-CoA hydratase